MEETKGKIKIKRSLMIMLGLFLFTFCFSKYDIVEIQGLNLYFYHIVIFVLFAMFLLNLKYRKKISVPNKYITIFVVWSLVITIISFTRFGINGLIVNYIVNYLFVIFLLNMKDEIGPYDYIKIIKSVFWIVLVLVYIKLLFNIEYVVDLLNGVIYRLNMMPTFFAGGINIEASWIALFGVFLISEKKGIIYWGLSLILAVVYLSRVAIIINILVLLWWIIINKKYKQIFMGLIIFIAISIVLSRFGFIDMMMNRFYSIGNEPGSEGRIAMWEYVPEVVSENLIGYGCGNAIKIIEEKAGMEYTEQAIHNIYLQVLVDQGFFGLILYVGMITFLVVKEIKNKFQNPFAMFLIIFFIQGALQMSGAEQALAFVVGIYLQNQKYNLNIKNEKIKKLAYEEK